MNNRESAVRSAGVTARCLADCHEAVAGARVRDKHRHGDHVFQAATLGLQCLVDGCEDITDLRFKIGDWRQ
jgi:hypothetical protein